MPVPPTLKRLVAIRRAEEQHCRTRMEHAITNLHRLDQACKSARERSRMSRQTIALAIASGDNEDRIAGLAELAAATRVSAILGMRLRSAEQEVIELRAAFLSRRIERRQAESLLETESKREAFEASRKAQIALDDWQRSRKNVLHSHRRPDVLPNHSREIGLSQDFEET